MKLNPDQAWIEFRINHPYAKVGSGKNFNVVIFNILKCSKLNRRQSGVTEKPNFPPFQNIPAENSAELISEIIKSLIKKFEF